MIYQDFISAAVTEDGRNKFGECDTLGNIPSPLRTFYTHCNPIDVEIYYPGIGVVKFCPAKDLASLCIDYSLGNNTFIFATCNGDPLFLMNDEVYITLHGKFYPEKVASSFEDFINTYICSRQ